MIFKSRHSIWAITFTHKSIGCEETDRRPKSPPSGICLPSHPSRLRLEAEEQEVMVLASESEAESEEEVKVEDRRRFLRPRRWINRPLTHLRVLAEGAVADAKLCIIQNGQ